MRDPLMEASEGMDGLSFRLGVTSDNGRAGCVTNCTLERKWMAVVWGDEVAVICLFVLFMHVCMLICMSLFQSFFVCLFRVCHVVGWSHVCVAVLDDDDAWLGWCGWNFWINILCIGMRETEFVWKTSVVATGNHASLLLNLLPIHLKQPPVGDQATE